MEVTKYQLQLLKQHGFKWFKNDSTDRVDKDVIFDVIPAANGFTVLYNDKAVLVSTTATIRKIEFKKLKG